jgi:hypothetical protein
MATPINAAAVAALADEWELIPVLDDANRVVDLIRMLSSGPV